MPGSGRSDTNWWLEEAGDSAVLQEGGEMDDRGRIKIPASLQGRLEWLRAAIRAGSCLFVLEEPCFVRLVPWEPHGPAVLDALGALANRDDDEANQLRLWLGRRYGRFVFTQEARPTMNRFMKAHLEGCGSRPPIPIVFLALRAFLEIRPAGSWPRHGIWRPSEYDHLP